MRKQLTLDLSCFILLISMLLGSNSITYAQANNGEHREFPVPNVSFSSKQYVVYKTEGAIAIDGKIDEEIWKKAHWTDLFVDAKGASEPAPKYATKAKLLWDDDYLYVAAQLEDPHLWGTMTERDMPLYLDNAFEIFIDPDHDTHNYVEFQINARGTIWDLFLSKPYRDQGQMLNGYNLIDYESGVYLDGKINTPTPADQGWTLEYKVPLKAILQLDSNRQSIQEGDQWKVNFQRAQRRLKVIDGGYELAINPETGKPFPPDFWVWSPQGLTDIHYPEMWGVIQFSKTVIGEKEVPFNKDTAQPYRWFLRQLYYKMREYQLDHGYFTKNLEALDIKDSMLTKYQNELTVETTQSLFEVTLLVKELDQVWHINQSGRVWSD